MAGRSNYQTCSFQCIRPGELWQCNWLEGAQTRRTRGKPKHRMSKLNENAETGTIVSIVYDIPNKKLSTLIGFSKGKPARPRRHGPVWKRANSNPTTTGHWECAKDAHGDKRNPQDFARWRGLAKMGIQTDRKMLNEQADILEVLHGKGVLEPIEREWPTI